MLQLARTSFATKKLALPFGPQLPATVEGYAFGDGSGCGTTPAVVNDFIIRWQKEMIAQWHEHIQNCWITDASTDILRAPNALRLLCERVSSWSVGCETLARETEWPCKALVRSSAATEHYHGRLLLITRNDSIVASLMVMLE